MAIILAILVLCYPMAGTVTQVQDDLITVQAIDGNQWQFYGDEYRVGDSVLMIMYTNGTTTIYDDSIIDVW